jgi:hypothetical protein
MWHKLSSSLASADVRERALNLASASARVLQPGPEHFRASTSPLLYARVLLCAGRPAEALAFLAASEHRSDTLADAVHMGLCLFWAGVLGDAADAEATDAEAADAKAGPGVDALGRALEKYCARLDGQKGAALYAVAGPEVRRVAARAVAGLGDWAGALQLLARIAGRVRLVGQWVPRRLATGHDDSPSADAPLCGFPRRPARRPGRSACVWRRRRRSRLATPRGRSTCLNGRWKASLATNWTPSSRWGCACGRLRGNRADDVAAVAEPAAGAAAGLGRGQRAAVGGRGAEV